MNAERSLRTSAAAMTVALVLMLFGLARGTARGIGLFLGVGLPLALVGLVLFGIFVLRDLRRRRAL